MPSGEPGARRGREGPGLAGHGAPHSGVSSSGGRLGSAPRPAPLMRAPVGGVCSRSGGYLAAPLREPVDRELFSATRAQVMVRSPSAQDFSLGVRVVTPRRLRS